MTQRRFVPRTVGEIAAMLGASVIGDPEWVLSGVAALEGASPADLSFLASSKYVARLAESRAGAILVTPELAEAAGPDTRRIVVPKPQEALLAVIARWYAPPDLPFRGVHPTAVVSAGASIAADACVEAHCLVGEGVVIGSGAWIGPLCDLGAGSRVGDGSHLIGQVTLYPAAQVGARTVIHAGTRIGSDGFGYVSRPEGHLKIPHLGGCLIGDGVEIGANCTIDRGSIGDTVIGHGSKLDNLVHIGHNVRVGEHCLMAAGCVIAGSARLEDFVVLGGHVAISGHLTVGRGARIAAKAGVAKDVPPGETWSGFPARPHREEMRRAGAMARLPRLLGALERLVGRDEGP